MPQQSPSGDRSENHNSGSPDKSPNQDRNSRIDFPLLDSGGHLDGLHYSQSSPLVCSISDRKYDSMSDSTSEKDRTSTLSASRHSCERSFERSLDNILDKCSEKSLDLNLSVDSYNGTASEGGSRHLDQTPSPFANKSSKVDKKKKGSWYTVSTSALLLFAHFSYLSLC